MPALLHASISSVPAGAVTFLPSTVRFTSGIGSLVCKYRKLFDRCFLLERARPAFEVIFKFLSELFHEGNRGHCSRIPKRAERSPKHVFRQVLHIVDIFL